MGASTTQALRSVPSSSTASSPSSSGGLTTGSSGDAVNQVQSRLTALGFYDGPITGYYGDMTEAAVRRFQAASGLTADGVVGSATLAALQRTPQSSSSTPSSTRTPDPDDGLLEQGESGPEVAQLQQRLKNLSYYNGAVDGEFGSLTADAVIRFQRSQGLTPDGVVGPATLSAIRQVENGSASSTNTPASNTTAPTFPSPQGSQTTPTQPTVVSPTPVTTLPPTNTSNSAFPAISSNPFPSNSVLSTASPDAIREIQQTLQTQGFYSGPIDGVMGYETQRAIDAARNAYGINSTDFGTTRPF